MFWKVFVISEELGIKISRWTLVFGLKSKEAVNMMNLQFHNNKVTYKNCLKFLGLVIEIQIKAMLRHDFPFEKNAGCFINKLQHKTPIKNSKREKFFSLIKVLNT